jgi:polyhydroxyalkanoate synthesis regulator phasin
MMADASIPDSLILAGAAGIVLLGLGVILGVVVKAFELMRNIKGEPPSEQLKASHDDLVKRVDRVESALEKVQREIHTINQDLTLAGEERARLLHERINPLVENTAAIRGGMEAFKQSFDNFTAMMSALIKAQGEKKS